MQYHYPMPARRKWTDEQLVEAVARSTTVAGVHRLLGIGGGGTGRATFKHIVRLNLSTSHFHGQGWARGKHKTQDEVRAALLPLLEQRGRVARLRERLIAAGLKDEQCEGCGLTEWLGQPAPLQLDHVDGDHLNNQLVNLKILCANCHVLTETWGFKGARRRPAQALVVKLEATPASEAGAL